MKLIIGNSNIPLATGISLPLVLRSPLFDTSDGKTPGSFIFNFNLPATPDLRRQFGQAHRTLRGGRATATLPYKLKDGSLKYEGTCTLIEADSDSYSISFAVENGDLAFALKDKTLKDLDLGGDIPVADVFSLANMPTEGDLINIQTDHEQHFAGTFNSGLIIQDLTNSMSSNGGIFTAPNAVSLTLRLKIIYHYLDGNCLLRLKVNGIDAVVLTMNDKSIYWAELNESIALNLSAGDVVSIYFDLITTYDALHNGWYLYYKMGKGGFIEFSSVNIFNMACQGNQNTFDFAIFPVENPEFFTNFPDDHFMLDNRSLKELYSKYFPVQNYYKDGQFSMILGGHLEGEYLSASNLFTPFVYFNTLLNKISAAAGYRILNSPYTGNESTANSHYNAVLYYPFAENTYLESDTHIAPVKPTFNLIDHVPAMSQIEFLREAAKVAGMRLVVSNNERTITFVSLQDQINLAPKQFPGILQANPLIKVSPEYKGIKFEFKKAPRDNYIAGHLKEIDPTIVYKGSVANPHDLFAITGQKINDCYLMLAVNELYVWRYDPKTYQVGWMFYSTNFFLSYQEGVEPFLTISNEFCPLLTHATMDNTVVSAVERGWLIPVTSQPGIMEGVPNTDNEFSKQILFYRGMQLDGQGNLYPLGTPGNKNFNNDIFGFSVALCAAGDSANMYLAHKTFMNWLAYDAKPVTYKAIFTRGQLAATKLHEPYIDTHGVVFLIKEIRINLMTDGLSIAEMDIYTR